MGGPGSSSSQSSLGDCNTQQCAAGVEVLAFVNTVKDSKSVEACREMLRTELQFRSCPWQGGPGVGG